MTFEDKNHGKQLIILRCCCIEFVAHMVRIFEWVGEALLCFNSDMDGIVASSLLMLFFFVNNK